MKLLHGDCLELMKEIPDGSVDLILCDPPYGTTDCKWDDVLLKEYTTHFENYPKNVLEYNTERGLHPTQKPVPLLEYLIKTYTNEGDTVLDNCMGSGSTGVAVKRVGGRHFVGIEQNKVYFDTAQKRIEEARA